MLGPTKRLGHCSEKTESETQFCLMLQCFCLENIFIQNIVWIIIKSRLQRENRNTAMQYKWFGSISVENKKTNLIQVANGFKCQDPDEDKSSSDGICLKCFPDTNVRDGIYFQLNNLITYQINISHIRTLIQWPGYISLWLRLLVSVSFYDQWRIECDPSPLQLWLKTWLQLSKQSHKWFVADTTMFYDNPLYLFIYLKTLWHKHIRITLLYLCNLQSTKHIFMSINYIVVLHFKFCLKNKTPRGESLLVSV